MLGFGIGEIVLIVVVAIIVLGPDKLPNALVEIVKTIRVIKKTINDAKDTLDREVNIAELKKEAIEYKEKLENSVNINIDTGHKEIVEDIKKDMNDIEHLFKDYQPKELDISESNKSTESNTNSDQIISNQESENTESLQYNNTTNTRHISEDSLELYNNDQNNESNMQENQNTDNFALNRDHIENYWNKKSQESHNDTNLDNTDSIESSQASFRKKFISQREGIL